MQHAQYWAIVGDAKTPNENITKLEEQILIYKEYVICLFPPNPQRPKRCQTTSRSTRRVAKHNNTQPHKGAAVHKWKKGKKDEYKPNSIGLNVTAPTNGINFNVAILSVGTTFG